MRKMEPAIPGAAELKFYLTQLKASGMAKSSVLRYERNLRHFLGYCEAEPAAITTDLINEFLQDSARRHSPATVNQYKSTIRGFFKYLLNTDKLAKDPSRLIRNDRIVRKDPPIFSPAQLKQLLDAVKAAIGHPPDYRAARDFTLYSLAYNAGLRAGVELLALDIKDVERRTSVAVVGKRKKSRRVPLNDAAQKAISDYLPLRKTLAAKDPRALFVSNRGTRLAIRTVEQNLKAWLKRAGIADDFWPHIFRHTCGTYMQARNKDLRVTQEFLGHSSPTTTAIYAHATPKALEEAADSL